ncbi:hypothetical protein CN326_07480 [Bacillus sp. AFS018417]|nr:hypothetical protein CN326_07480 [Bacillus sp. AFS018417]
MGDKKKPPLVEVSFHLKRKEAAILLKSRVAFLHDRKGLSIVYGLHMIKVRALAYNAAPVFIESLPLY